MKPYALPVVLGVLAFCTLGCGVAKQSLGYQRLDPDRRAAAAAQREVAEIESRQDTQREAEPLTAKEILTRAKHIVRESERYLEGAKPPLTKPQLAWQKAQDFAKEAIEAAAAWDAEKAKSKPDEDLLATHLTKARERYVLASDMRGQANVTEEILYSNYFRLHSGAATVRPYTFVRRASDNRRVLSSGARTAFYAQTDFLYRTAWSSPAAINEDLGSQDNFGRWLPQDYDLRLGFINESRIQDEWTEAIAGAKDAANGDWYSEGTLGWVLAMNNISLDPADANVDLPRGTWSLDLHGALQTDRDGFNTTGTYMAGPGTAWSVPVTVGGNKRLATVAAGAYFGIHEYPRADPDNSITDDTAVIHFNRLLSFGVRIDLTVPLTNGIEAVLQARHYSPLSNNDIPDDWSLFVGVSLPVGRLVRDLLQ